MTLGRERIESKVHMRDDDAERYEVDVNILFMYHY